MEKWSPSGDVHRGIYVPGSQEKGGQEQAGGAVERLITVGKYSDILRVMGTRFLTLRKGIYKYGKVVG